MRKFSFDEIQNAFVNGAISLEDFVSVLAESFGPKKTRKILRKNLESVLMKHGISTEERKEFLSLVSILVKKAMERGEVTCKYLE